mgnify:CR=1 FL=1
MLNSASLARSVVGRTGSCFGAFKRLPLKAPEIILMLEKKIGKKAQGGWHLLLEIVDRDNQC